MNVRKVKEKKFLKNHVPYQKIESQNHPTKNIYYSIPFLKTQNDKSDYQCCFFYKLENYPG